MYILHTATGAQMGNSWSSAEVLKALKRAGFKQVSQRGSHIKLRNASGKTVILPHPKKDLATGTLASISRQSGIVF